MKFFFDNNLSIHLARAIAALCEPEGVRVAHLRDDFDQDVTDAEWIAKLSAEGDWAVVTRDRLIRSPLEREALRRSGLTVFLLFRTWAHQTQWDKAAQLVRWWPRIMDQAALVTGGAVFKDPWKFSGRGRFEQMRI